jgi:hypothetical protein
MIACSGAENKKCSGQFNDPLDFITSMKDWMTSEVHNGPFAGVLMGTVLDRSATPPATDAASYDYNKVRMESVSRTNRPRLSARSIRILFTPASPTMQWISGAHLNGATSTTRLE